jgi:hypothetical protein
MGYPNPQSLGGEVMFDEEPKRDSHDQCRFEIQRLESGLAAANKTISARDRECKSEHYETLNSCIERIKVLEDALKYAIEQEEHSRYCDAIKGPEPETWLVEKDCNCWVKDARAALEVKP